VAVRLCMSRLVASMSMASKLGESLYKKSSSPVSVSMVVIPATTIFLQDVGQRLAAGRHTARHGLYPALGGRHTAVVGATLSLEIAFAVTSHAMQIEREHLR